MKNKIEEVLLKKFNSVYCNTCSGEYCDECNRKMMNWSISQECAEEIADDILRIVLYHVKSIVEGAKLCTKNDTANNT